MTDKSKWLLVTIGIQLILVAFIFKDVLVHPNNYFFEGGNEAIKNYLIPAFFVKYDSGIHFSGMDYPYGEHPVFADSQFPISYCLQFIQHHFFEVAEYVPGIFNMLMMLSFLPCAAFIFLILAEFRVKNWYAMISAIGITMLSPQVLKMKGHFSLSYLFYIPMIWYFMMRLMQSEKKWKWILLMITSNLIFGLIHLYYLAIILSFQVFFCAMYAFQQQRKKNPFVKNAGSILLSSIVPFLIIQAFIFLSDPTNDRIKFPWGFFFTYASFNSTYLPPLNNFLNFLHLQNGFSEGFAYVGVVGWTGSILLITKLVRKWILKKRNFLIIPDFLRWSLYASIIVFLFSCALPFKFGMEGLIEWLGPLRQFRAIGRFAWIYYYVFSVTGVYCLYQLIRLYSIKQRLWLSYGILILMIAGWSIDSYFNFQTVINHFKPYPVAKEFTASNETELMLKKENKMVRDFQAILTLPFFQVGSEKFWFDGDRSLWHGMKVSFETGLPLVDGYMGRTSLSRSLRIIQLFSDEKIEKKILHDWPSKKPLLLIVIKDSLTANEKAIVAKSKFLFEKADEIIYELPVETFNPVFDSIRNNFFAKRDSFWSVGNNGFADAPDIKVWKKNFSLAGFLSETPYQDSGTVKLLSTAIDDDNGQVYEASVWVKIFSNSYELPVLAYNQEDKKGNVVDQQIIFLKRDPDNYDGWVRAMCSFQLKKQGNTVNLLVKGKYLEADRFLLRPADVNIYDEVKDDSSFVLNNYFIPPPDHSLH